ncbi:RNA exonuclease [Phlyctema vagabunda]|uniref:RNA exonuclease n=1 Tax=Phlyctema vagabunda TaxID=108571 RepID=A0ABR4PGL4_9HELO
MFTTKGLFSSVPCPHQERCMLPQCMFSHGPAEPQGTADGRQTTTETRSADVQDGQRKRRKIEVADDGDPARAPEQPKSPEAILKPDPDPLSKPLSAKPADTVAPKKASSLQRPISPPPLRRTTSSVAPQSYTPQTPAKSAAKTPLKKEALNPRMIKKGAPASHDMRFRLLRALHEQFVRLNSELAKDANDKEEKLVLSEQELITKALDIEENAAAVASIYSNVVKNNILSYKRMKVGQWKTEREKDVAEANAVNASTQKDSPFAKPLGSPKTIDTGLSVEEEIALLPRLRTPVEDLSKHGYVSKVPTEAEIQSANSGMDAAKGWEVCDRCKTRFQVFPDRREEDGALTSGGTCTYHFGKPFWQERSATDPKAKREKRYRCCGQAMGDSPGCVQAECHVFKISEVKRLAAVLNFVETPANSNAPPEKPVCIDGEMGFTVHGLELIRLTATSWPGGEELLDVLVKPVGIVLDLNSRYSGVLPEDMVNAIPWNAKEPSSSNSTGCKLKIASSPAEARSLLLRHISPQTPLIGHGLENDLNAIRLIHPTLVDTALLFPHRMGLPYRNGLKMLMQIHLNREIQVTSNVDGKVVGHDSKEDANAAGDLVRVAIGHEWAKMKREGWKLMGGAFLPPTPKAAPAFDLETIPKGPRLTVEELERDPTVVVPKRVISAKHVGEKRQRDEMEEGEVNQ